MWPFVIGAGAAAAGYGLWKLGTVSRGMAIPQARDGRALLVIGMQSGFVQKLADGPKVLSAITDRARAARAKGETVIALRQVWRSPMGTALGIAYGGAGLPASEATALEAEIARLADHILDKHQQDGFARPDLDDLLSELEVGDLEICGLEGLQDIRATTLAALNRGYRVRIDPALVLSSNPAKFARMRARWPLEDR